MLDTVLLIIPLVQIKFPPKVVDHFQSSHEDGFGQVKKTWIMDLHTITKYLKVFDVLAQQITKPSSQGSVCILILRMFI